MGAPQLQQRILGDCQHVALIGGGANIYVALVCGIRGLEGNTTGASMSIDIAKSDRLNVQEFCSVDTVEDYFKMLFTESSGVS